MVLIVYLLVADGPNGEKPPLSKLLSQIVIMTDSAYLATVMSDDIWKWEGKGYVTSKGKPIINEKELRDLRNIFILFEEEGVGVKIWHVVKAAVKEANTIAKYSFVVEEDEEENSKGLEQLKREEEMKKEEEYCSRNK